MKDVFLLDTKGSTVMPPHEITPYILKTNQEKKRFSLHLSQTSSFLLSNIDLHKFFVTIQNNKGWAMRTRENSVLQK